MKFETAWGFYKSNRAIALAAHVSDQAVNQWKAKGIVPFLSAITLESQSRGAIKVDRTVYVKKPRNGA